MLFPFFHISPFSKVSLRNSKSIREFKKKGKKEKGKKYV
jgi:hypothetical protein